MSSFIVFVILLAFVFDFINGFHDAANSIATIVATEVLKPHWAVIWAAFFNFIAFLFFHLKVANTIGMGLVMPDILTPYVIFAAISSAIIWNLITWYFGLPSSSSHALIGGLVGGGIMQAGVSVINLTGLLKVLVSIILSPLLGLLLGALLVFALKALTRRWHVAKVNRWFGALQFISAALLSLGHGGNDAQKTMGIIAILLFSSNMLGSEFYVPLWVMISCNFVMGLGTLFGGWRIVHTLGKKITKLDRLGGCVAETATATTLFLATDLGIPVSTTHTIMGAITGVGLYNGFWASHREMMKKILSAWVLTIPATGMIAGLFVLVKK